MKVFNHSSRLPLLRSLLYYVNHTTYLSSHRLYTSVSPFTLAFGTVSLHVSVVPFLLLAFRALRVLFSGCAVVSAFGDLPLWPFLVLGCPTCHTDFSPNILNC